MEKDLKVIVIANHKGGVAKSTTSFALSTLFSSDNHEKITRYSMQRKAKKTLLITLDFQSDLSKLMLGEEKFEKLNGGVLDAIAEQDATPYTVQLQENLWILPATQSLVQFEELYYTQLPQICKENNLDIDKLLENAVKPAVDALGIEVIIIDTNPYMSKILLQGLAVSLGAPTEVVIPFSLEKTGKISIDNIADTLLATKENINPNIHIAGILAILLESHQSNFVKGYLEEIEKDYEGLLFKSMIRRKTPIKSIVENGFDEKYKKNRDAFSDYYEFFNELKERIYEQKVVSS